MTPSLGISAVVFLLRKATGGSQTSTAAVWNQVNYAGALDQCCFKDKLKVSSLDIGT